MSLVPVHLQWWLYYTRDRLDFVLFIWLHWYSNIYRIVWILSARFDLYVYFLKNCFHTVWVAQHDIIIYKANRMTMNFDFLIFLSIAFREVGLYDADSAYFGCGVKCQPIEYSFNQTMGSWENSLKYNIFCQ